MVKEIPDRWENYSPIGKTIEGTRFIPFKVPLRERVSDKVESEKRLDDRILLKNIPNLGLIIDLTNTHRYYNPKVFQEESVEHKKLMIPGRETPPQQTTNHFIKIVKDFIDNNKNNDKLIGVHCTHGVNRTGYLICYYMISQMTIEPKEAMDKFANARGHQIERTNYITDLQRLKLLDKRIWRDRSNSVNRDASNRSRKRSNNSRDRNNMYENGRCRSPHRGFKRENSFSTCDHVEGRSAQRCTDHHCTMSKRSRSINLDYYKTRPTFDMQRKNYKHISKND